LKKYEIDFSNFEEREGMSRKRKQKLNLDVLLFPFINFFKRVGELKFLIYSRENTAILQ